MRTGGEIIIDYLIKEGVEFVIGIPGHGCLALFDALRDRVQKNKIKYIQVMQEMDAVYIADGYYRATGKPLAVITSIGPGALNTIIGLATAFVDSTPTLVIMGDTHTNMRGVGVLQEIERKHDSDILSCFRPITKRCWRAENVRQLPKIMSRAFNQMLSGRRGPVALAVPMDVQAAETDVEFEDGQNKAQNAVEALAEDIEKAVALMANAKRPVIVAGGGVYYSRKYKELQELAEYWGAAVVTTMAGKGCFPENHYLYGWHGGSKGTDVGNYHCRTADVILALGCRFADESTSSYRKGVTYNFPQTKLIHVDIDASEIGKNYSCDVGIIGDVAAVMPQLLQGLKKSQIDFADKRKDYIQDIKSHKEKWFKKLDGFLDETDSLTISHVLKTFKDIFPKDGYVVTSSGNTQAQMLQEYCVETPGTFITTGGFSTMGFAFPAGMGVKLAKPKSNVAVFVGDGDFMMAMQEMSVLVQLGINVTIILLNNCGWLAIRDLQLDVFGKPYDFGCQFKAADGSSYTPDFAKVAKAFGIDSIRVSSKEELRPSLEKAINSDKPFLVEVMVTTEYPYSGGKATGWWDVPIPAYMTEKRKAYLKCVSEEKY